MMIFMQVHPKITGLVPLGIPELQVLEPQKLSGWFGLATEKSSMTMALFQQTSL